MIEHYFLQSTENKHFISGKFHGNCPEIEIFRVLGSDWENVFHRHFHNTLAFVGGVPSTRNTRISLILETFPGFSMAICSDFPEADTLRTH